MIARLQRLWRTHRRLSLAFLLAVVLTAGFAIRAVLFVPPFRHPPTDPVIEGWMTPRFVAHGWALPSEVMAQTLGLKPGEGRRQTLAQIAAAQGITVDELALRIEAAARQFRATHPPPGP